MARTFVLAVVRVGLSCVFHSEHPCRIFCSFLSFSEYFEYFASGFPSNATPATDRIL